MTELEQAAVQSFIDRFGRRPTVLGVAPGRVELLGNHTDHNSGLVMAAAIDRYTCVAASVNESAQVRVWSANSNATDEFELPEVTALARGSWANYVRAVVAGFVDAGVPVPGFDSVVMGDIPLGAGLSSSASLECALAMALAGLADPQVELECTGGMPLARLLQEVEQRVVGVQCGILDQFSSIFGRSGHALFLDCATLERDAVPLGTDPPAIVVCHSGAPRSLATGKYNERRTECEAALDALSKRVGASERPGSLSDLSLEQFHSLEQGLPPLLARRARHVITENQRVRTGFKILRDSGAVAEFGRLMFQSHESSRNDFENSVEQLDTLIEIARGLPGCLGAKLSGGGWGGCTVNLVDKQHADSFARQLAAEYYCRTGLTVVPWRCQASAGARWKAL